jgi:HK97 family phage major capsid protein
VPAGQDDLLSELDRILREEAGARDGTGYRWYMSPEWLAEVRKLRTNGANGKPLYVPRAARTAQWQTAGTLYGYPVTVGESFGVPELKEKP